MGLDASQKLRTTIEIDLKDIAVLRSFDPKSGTLQTTASILFKKLINELKQSSITPGDFSNYQHAIAGCHIVLAYGASEYVSIGGVKFFRDGYVERSTSAVAATGSVDSVAGETPNRDVTRGVKKLARKVKGA